MSDAKLAIVAGIGPGLSGSIAKALSAEGYKVGGLARRQENLQALETELGAENFKGIKTDLTSMGELTAAISEFEEKFGPVELYVHNATGFHVGPFLETSKEDFEMVWRSGVLSAFNGGQAVLPGMVERGKGTLLISGATAAMRGGANFSAFASAKFALRGLAQSLARQFGPQGVHVVHVVIDGVIWGPSAERFGVAREKCLDPDELAQAYVALARQPRSCWTHEIDIRPSTETF